MPTPAVMLFSCRLAARLEGQCADRETRREETRCCRRTWAPLGAGVVSQVSTTLPIGEPSDPSDDQVSRVVRTAIAGS